MANSRRRLHCYTGSHLKAIRPDRAAYMIEKIEGLRVYGFGGHARSVADVAVALESSNWSLLTSMRRGREFPGISGHQGVRGRPAGNGSVSPRLE